MTNFVRVEEMLKLLGSSGEKIMFVLKFNDRESLWCVCSGNVLIILEVLCRLVWARSTEQYRRCAIISVVHRSGCSST